jgi:hypothetical protein
MEDFNQQTVEGLTQSVVWKKKNINNDIETNVFVFPTRISQVQY